MPKGVEIEDFPAKLELVRGRVNISRTELARTVKVDKSTIARWLSGVTFPLDHHLSALTDLMSAHMDGFVRLDWNQDLAQFAELIGVASDSVREPAPAESAAGLPAMFLQSLALGRAQAVDVAPIYEGYWHMFRPYFANNGDVAFCAVEIARRGGALQFRYSDGYFTYSGEIFVIGGQLYFIGEEPERKDELLMMIFNGVNWPRVELLDGIMTGVAGDAGHTPGAMRVVLELQADLAGDQAADAKIWAKMTEETREITLTGREPEMTGRFEKALESAVSWPNEQPERRDHILTVPAHLSLSAGKTRN